MKLAITGLLLDNYRVKDGDKAGSHYVTLKDETGGQVKLVMPAELDEKAGKLPELDKFTLQAEVKPRVFGQGKESNQALFVLSFAVSGVGGK